MNADDTVCVECRRVNLCDLCDVMKHWGEKAATSWKELEEELRRSSKIAEGCKALQRKMP